MKKKIKNYRKFILKKNESQKRITVHPASIELLVDTTWDFAHTILWRYFSFTDEEIKLAKIFIREYYEKIPAEQFNASAGNYFTSYCERVLLAKKYIHRFPCGHITHPCIWLDKRNPDGFTGTKTWPERVLRKNRKTHLFFLTELKKHGLFTKPFHSIPFTF